MYSLNTHEKKKKKKKAKIDTTLIFEDATVCTLF